MELTELNAISPIDGRYRSKTVALGRFFSEEALLRYRVRVEVDYFIALCHIPLPQLAGVNNAQLAALQGVYENFSTKDAQAIKALEKITNHDVKAVEYFLKEKWEVLGLGAYKEFIHFGLTSQDINNTAIPLSVKEALEEIYKPALRALLEKLNGLAKDWETIPVLARTHGQPASPTRLGKEFRVFAVRLEEQLRLLECLPIAAKLGGATGNFNAHHLAYPGIDWVAFGRNFVEQRLGLHYSFPTTQVEHYDHLAALCDAWKRINTIVIDLNRDCWMYISMEYFKQQIQKQEVGSSAMPHKVNPIAFENSEGNLGLANALLEHIAGKLPISRLQRDLTDSTVLRNIGVSVAHTLIGFQATLKGLNELLLNPSKIEEDLENNWAVLAEAVQTVLRREGVSQPYERLKEFARTHQKITRQSLITFIDTLPVSETVKAELKKITPQSYTGV